MKTIFKTTSNHVNAPFIRDERGRRVPKGVVFNVLDDCFDNGIFYYSEGGKRRRAFSRQGCWYFNETPEYRLYLMRGGWYCLEKRDKVAGANWPIRFEITAEEAREIATGRGVAAKKTFDSYFEKVLSL